MDKTVINERDMVAQFKANNLQGFYDFVESYDRSVAASMRARGFKLMNQAKRTVLFTFGEVTYSRNRWYKNGVCEIPVDRKLGLDKNIRYSAELIYQIADLAAVLPYRKVVDVIQMVYQIYITKETVVKAIEQARKLLEEKEDYRYFEMAREDKIKADRIYIEGDGVFFNTSDTNRQRMEIAHFIIHTGKGKGPEGRLTLANKREVVEKSNYLAREKVLDILENEFEITKETIFITNSDGGKGYTPYIFQELVKAFPHKAHYHFWDRYHVNRELAQMLSSGPKELYSQAMKALNTHSRKSMITTLDTYESLIETESEQERFESFKKRLLNNFQYTKTPEKHGLSDTVIGIMESQHRKLTFRMKHRGISWTEDGALTVANLIILKDRGELRDLFFGNWREEYKKYKAMEGSAGNASDHSARKYSMNVSTNKITAKFSKNRE
ncbi:ISLre2 family transposase [Streptococcus suis]